MICFDPRRLEPLWTAWSVFCAAERMLETQSTFIDAAQEGWRALVLKQALVLIRRNRAISWRVRVSMGTPASQPIHAVLSPGSASDASESLAFSIGRESTRPSPVDSENIAKATFAILHSEGHEGKIYDMTGPESLTMAEIVERISQATGKAIRYINRTMEEYRRAMLAAGASPERADAFVELWRERSECSMSIMSKQKRVAWGNRVPPHTLL